MYLTDFKPGDRVSCFVEGILEEDFGTVIAHDEWKKVAGIKASTISFLKDAFKYRHWLAHGRYWTLKAGKKRYDFYELYNLAAEVDTFPFKRI